MSTLPFLPYFFTFWKYDYLYDRTLFACVFAVVIAGILLWKHSKLLSITVTYFLLNSLWIPFYTHNKYLKIFHAYNSSLTDVSVKGLVFFTACLFTACFIKVSTITKLFDNMKWILTLFLGSSILLRHYGIADSAMSNQSIGLTTASIMFSIAMFRSNRWHNVLNALLISVVFYQVHSIMGVASLIFCVLLYLLVSGRILSFLICFMAIALLSLYMYLIDQTIFYLNLRDQIAITSVKILTQYDAIWTGMGGFSFRYFYVLHQHISKEMIDGGYVLFAHNDYIQILFEHGIVGLVLAVLLILKLLYTGIKTNNYLYVMIVCFACNMMGNSPMVMPSDLLLLFMAIRLLLQRENNGPIIN